PEHCWKQLTRPLAELSSVCAFRRATPFHCIRLQIALRLSRFIELQGSRPPLFGRQFQEGVPSFTPELLRGTSPPTLRARGGCGPWPATDTRRTMELTENKPTSE